jgi:hypothetical protein
VYLGTAERPERLRVPAGGDERQLGRAVVLGDGDAARGRPCRDVAGPSGAGNDRGAPAGRLSSRSANTAGTACTAVAFAG